MEEHNLDVIMLSETRSTSYYSYTSENHLVVLSGNTRDKHAGVGAVVHPRVRPHLADIVLVSNRLLHWYLTGRGAVYMCWELTRRTRVTTTTPLENHFGTSWKTM